MNSIVIIGGCSWACGEWKDHRTRNPWTPDIEHHGLATYMRHDGYSIINLAQPATSNQNTADRIKSWALQNIEYRVGNVVIFQTEYTRETAPEYTNDFARARRASDLQSWWTDKFYQQLSSISQHLECPVTLIGGCSDTAGKDTLSKYPGLRIGCQSMTNLVLENHHTVANPVMSWYGQIAESFVERLKPQLVATELSNLLDMIDAGHQRMNKIAKSKEYFWPDGAHPNRHAHKILYQYLRDQQLI